MKIRPSPFLKLSAVTASGETVSIENKVLRKLKFPDFQKNLGDNAICIVCNFRFRDKTRDWADNIKAICHPFHDEATSIFPKNKKLVLLSESDFMDQLWVPVKTARRIHYDYTIFTLDTRQGVKCKGFHIIPLIVSIGQQMGLRGRIIDYYPTTLKNATPINPQPWSFDHDLLKTRKRLRRAKIEIIRGEHSQKDLCSMMTTSRFLIFPNNRDASPRMITEALIRGCPLMVNGRIYGGWKYINKVNGVFFDGPDNRKEMEEKKDHFTDSVKKAMEYMVNHASKFNREDIKNDFYSKYGFFNSAKRLANLLNEIEGKEKYKYVFYRSFQPLLAKWGKYTA